MPIVIPKIESTESLPQGGGQRRGVPSVSPGEIGISREIEQVSESLRKHEETIELQHDRAVYQGTITAFRDRAVSELRGHLDKVGGLAKGSLAEYTKWYDKEMNKITSELGSKRQQEFFTDAALNLRNSDITALSAHQAKEHKVHLRNEIDNAQNMAISESASHPGDIKLIEGQINNIKTQLEAYAPGEDVSLELRERSTPIYLASLQSLTQTDPVRAKLFLEAWKEELGTKYPQAKKIVDREYAYAIAKSKYTNSYTDQIDFIQEMDEDILGSEAKSAAVSRIRTERYEDKYQREEEYNDLLNKHRNTINGLIMQGSYSAALEQNKGAVGLDETDRRVLEDVIKSHAKDGNTGTIFSEYDVDYVKDVLADAEKGIVPSGPVPKKLDEKHYKLGVFVAEHANKEARGELGPLESRAYTAVKSIIQGLELDDPREEALMVGRKMNELGEYIKANPGADYMKYIDEQLLPEEKGWWIVNWLKKVASGPVGEVLSLGHPGAAPANIYDRVFGVEEPSARERAISTLESAGKPITERNIEYVIKNAN